MIAAETYVEALQVINRLWAAMDRADYLAILDLLTADCRWQRDRWRVGHADIRQSLEDRHPKLVSRHIVANLAVEMDGDALDCRYALTIFGATPADGAPPPYLTTGQRMADCQAKVRARDGRWQIAELSARLMFERPPRTENAA